MAYLAKSLKPQSIKQYLNVIRILHLESGLQNPLADNWFLNTVVQGVKRDKGQPVSRKLPVTKDILLKILGCLNMENSQNATFWAACLVAFFGMMRKSSLFPKNPAAVNHLTLQKCLLHQWGMSMLLTYSKTIQFSNRQVYVSFPWHADQRLCAARAVIKAVHAAKSSNPDHFIFSYYDHGNIRPMTYQGFSSMLKAILLKLGLPLSQYSGHSFRRGGATHAFHCNVPTETIKAQGDWKSLSYLDYLDVSTEAQRAFSLKPMFV